MNTYKEKTELADVIWGVNQIKEQSAIANVNSDYEKFSVLWYIKCLVTIYIQMLVMALIQYKH